MFFQDRWYVRGFDCEKKEVCTFRPELRIQSLELLLPGRFEIPASERQARPTPISTNGTSAKGSLPVCTARWPLLWPFGYAKTRSIRASNCKIATSSWKFGTWTR